MTAVGIILALLFYAVLGSASLTSIGLSAIIIGLTGISIASTGPYKLIIFLAITFSIINASLAFLGQNNIGLYFSADVIAYIIIALFYVRFDPRARTGLSTVSVLIFVWFLVMAALRVVKLIG